MKKGTDRSCVDHEITFGRGLERATVTVCTDEDYQYAFISDIGIDTPDEERDGIDWLELLPLRYEVRRISEGRYEIRDDRNRKESAGHFSGNWRTAALACWKVNREDIARLRRGLKDGSISCIPGKGLRGFEI